ncbi:unnamed protein product [Phytophthora fragariaefolia]|uniref:Unnamed protein product n=1 Tax=Phytophthora fragariaefolia TaxID=1490495 RepID=A0A9W6UDQ5_9STRA|nr:unnamed protein product [Phytophthora fragariaefolia]
MPGVPDTWTRLMASSFGGAKFGSFVVVYLDDICIFSATIELHLQHLEAVLIELRANRLELQGFLGLVGYYQRFIADVATLLAPLSDLSKDQVTWRWGQSQEDSFYAVKAALTQAPVLQLPNFPLPFIVTTDASGVGVRSMLSQLKNGHVRTAATSVNVSASFRVQHRAVQDITRNADSFDRSQDLSSRGFLFDEAGQQVHIVNKLVKQRQHRGRREFLVDRLDEPASQQSWEPESNLTHLTHWNGQLADLRRKPTARTNPVARRERQRQATIRSSHYNLRSTSSSQASGVENVMKLPCKRLPSLARPIDGLLLGRHRPSRVDERPVSLLSASQASPRHCASRDHLQRAQHRRNAAHPTRAAPTSSLLLGCQWK